MLCINAENSVDNNIARVFLFEVKLLHDKLLIMVLFNNFLLIIEPLDY